MILLIDTTKDYHGKQLVAMLEVSEHAGACEYIDTENMNISPCLGCNCCWLKTPGSCPIKDDTNSSSKHSRRKALTRRLLNGAVPSRWTTSHGSEEYP